MFQHSATQLLNLATHALTLAQKKGASSAEVDLSETLGQTVQVRLGNVDQIEHQQNKSLDITVYLGKSKGRASTTDFSSDALNNTVQAALNIARYTEQDDCAGLADPNLMAKNIHDLDKYHPWDLNTQDAIILAKECEQAAFDSDKRIVNSEGASIHTGHHQFVYANTHGFLQHQKSTHHTLSCSIVARDDSGMEGNYWFDGKANAKHLSSVQEIGQKAAWRATRSLGAKSIPTGVYPIILDSVISGSLIGHLVGALSGSALYRQSSFLLNSLGKKIMPETFFLREEPHIPQAAGSTYFDAEGVATQPRFVIENGIIQAYFLNSYSARKLNMTTTANAGGTHNLHLNHTHATQADLLKDMNKGLLITKLMGQGINIITGDYSRGAAGFWVENGVIVHPVSGITIASTLQNMLANIQGVSDDSVPYSSNKIGSIWLEKMTVASS